MNKLLSFLFLLTIIVACGEDNERCPDGISYKKNKDLDFLPYGVGDIVFFADSLGNRDTLKVTLYSTDIRYLGGASCTESEIMDVDVILNYDSGKICNMGFMSNPTFEGFSTDGAYDCGGGFSALFYGGRIKSISNYEFDSINYEEVLEISLEDFDSDIEKIVIAKNTGFLFFTINSIMRKSI